MASENKKRKEKNAISHHGMALKEKNKFKRYCYFNASLRKFKKIIED